MKLLSSGVLVLALFSATNAAADTPTGRYVFDTEITGEGKLPDHPDGYPSCEEDSKGQAKRILGKKGQTVAIEYVKSAHRVRVGSTLYDFMDDDEKAVGATKLAGEANDSVRVLTYVHFWRVNASAVALKMEMDMVLDGEVKCGDYYWFRGTLAH